jgi:transcription termination/antitermination protein NusG
LLKESENPPILYPEGLAIPQLTGQWWVVHTKSRNEKALAQDLMAKEIPYFLPMSLNIRRHKERTFKSLLPVFTGYMFFCGKELDRVEVLKTNRVAGILDVVDQAKLIGELAQIEQALRAGAPLLPHDYIKKGQWCRVTAGPLMGLEGIVLEVKKITRLVLQIEMLGQATCVEIDVNMIERIETPTYKQAGV